LNVKINYNAGDESLAALTELAKADEDRKT
jgi:hypothetical protein